MEALLRQSTAGATRYPASRLECSDSIAALSRALIDTRASTRRRDDIHQRVLHAVHVDACVLHEVHDRDRVSRARRPCDQTRSRAQTMAGFVRRVRARKAIDLPTARSRNGGQGGDRLEFEAARASAADLKP